MRTRFRPWQLLALGLVAALAACSCPPPQAPATPAPGPETAPPAGPDTTPPGDQPTGDQPTGDQPTGDQPGPGLPLMGQPCDPAAGCSLGLTCVSYYGIAGKSGPELHSCEFPCPGGSSEQCPEGLRCVRIADGPGEVCRPADAAVPPSP